MRGGTLRNLFTVQEPTTTLDAYGQPVKTWVNSGTTWGAVTSLSGGESLSEAGTTADRNHNITVRFYERLNAGWRLVLDARVFEITAVINLDERRQQMNVAARETITA